MQWPDGADHPDQIAIDKMKNAIDDEITYVITNVQPASVERVNEACSPPAAAGR